MKKLQYGFLALCLSASAIMAQDKLEQLETKTAKIIEISKSVSPQGTNGTNATTTVATYDFTVAGAAYTTGPDPMVEVETGVWAMIAGDGNSDGAIDAADQNSVWRPANGQVWDYSTTGLADFNMDNSIDATDQNLFWRPNNGKSTQVP